MQIGILSVVIVVAGLVLWRVLARRRAALLAERWHGEVLEKIADAGDARGTYRFVKVRFENGQTSFVRLRATLWEELQPHDKLVKHAGSIDPVRE